MLNIAIDAPTAFGIKKPTEVAEAVALGAEEDAAFLAGGGDLLDRVKSRLHAPKTLVSLNGLRQLRGIAEGNGALIIGALTSLSTVERDPALRRRFPALSLAASRVATPQIRTRASLGGNLLQDSRCAYYREGWDCHRAGGARCYALTGIHTEHAIFGGGPCYTVTPSDLAPALIALDARLSVRGEDGARTMPIAELFVVPREDLRHMHTLQPGEILTRVVIPIKPHRHSHFIKIAVRGAWDFALTSAAVAAERNDGKVRNCRIVLGGVAPVPWRCRQAEAVLEGSSLTPADIETAAASALADAAPLPDNEYKLALVRQAVAAALKELAT
jgi:xanthine dehydrogenase YagS FAD-binding subunit